VNLLNATARVAGFTTSTDKSGRQWLVVAIKGAYSIPESPAEEPRLLDEQLPLITTDVATGSPGVSAPLYETDFAPHKPRCDVLLNGSCYAPEGKPAQRVTVSLRLGSLTKSFQVVGKRVYEGSLLSGPSEPAPFKVLPIGYDTAYGGVDRTHEDPAQHQWYSLNHAGLGYHPSASTSALRGLPLPHTEELENPVRRADGRYTPMAFGPVARAWSQRIRWAGTYDQAWLDQQFPFLPQDFDTRYFQCAPEDQQIDYPRGGEEVALLNLTPKGRTRFRLPANLTLPIAFITQEREVDEIAAVVDTVLIEPDQQRFSLVWRAARALRRNLREVTEVRIAERARDIERKWAREVRQRDKQVFPSLAEAVAASRRARRR
jgi:hypothetical protein